MNRGPVSNQFPAREPAALRIALIGESPGDTEVRTGIPFSGAAGCLLNSALASVGLSREECFVGSVCQMRPGAASNDFSLLPWEGAEVQEGIAALLRDLSAWRPNIVVCLGNVPLHLFKCGNVAPPKTPKSGYKWPSAVTKWRGSLFLSHEQLTSGSSGQSHAGSGTPGLTSKCTVVGAPDANLAGSSIQSPLEGVGCAMDSACIPPLLPPAVNSARGERGESPGVMALLEARGITLLAALSFKCVSTWHPAFVLRVYSKLFDLRQDLRRARDEASTPVLTLDTLDIRWGPERIAVIEPPTLDGAAESCCNNELGVSIPAIATASNLVESAPSISSVIIEPAHATP